MNALPPGVMAENRLARLLRPRTIAVFGGHAAAEVVHQADKIGFAGEIWPVHPKHDEICGRPVYRTVAALPAAPDAAFVGVNRHASIAVMGALACAGAGGAVAFASGYAEAGEEGAALEAALRAAAGEMPFFGPNCYGFINYLDRALVWPDQHGCAPVPRGVAIITQSGNIGLNVTMQKRALPIGYLITLGNQAALGHAAVMEAVLDDPRVTAVGLHMEAVGDADALARVVARARAQGVAVVALKTGSSAAGARIAMSHTASLGSADAVVDAFFRRIGVARVRSVPALLEALKLLHYFGPLPERSITSLSCSGGEAALMADAAEAAGLVMQTLSAAAHADIAATLPELVSISNPLDYHTFGWRNRPALAATFGAMMRAGAALNLLILDFPRPDRCETADWDIAAAAMMDAAATEGARAAIVATLPEALPEAQAAAMAAHGVVPLFGLETALEAVACVADVGDASGRASPLTRGALGRGVEAAAMCLSEWESKQALARHAVPVPAGDLANSVAEAVTCAAALGFPVVVKAAGADLAHKTELGAVRLNLRDAASVAEAAGMLLGLRGVVLVERMVRDCVAELIVGMARDAAIGAYLVLGSGGILAELVGDTVTLLLPATAAEIDAALRRLRVGALLDGFRGRPAGDRVAAIGAILAIQDFVLAHLDRLAELDVNPLMVCQNGAFAADVLIRMVPEVAHG